MAEKVNGSGHPAQDEISGGGASLAQACVGQGLWPLPGEAPVLHRFPQSLATLSIASLGESNW
jgi:hypothetical protein